MPYLHTIPQSEAPVRSRRSMSLAAALRRREKKFPLSGRLSRVGKGTVPKEGDGSPISRQVSRGTDVPVRNFLYSLFSTLAEFVIPRLTRPCFQSVARFVHHQDQSVPAVPISLP
jgi:hypothetical protein